MFMVYQSLFLSSYFPLSVHDLLTVNPQINLLLIGTYVIKKYNSTLRVIKKEKIINNKKKNLQRISNAPLNFANQY